MQISVSVMGEKLGVPTSSWPHSKASSGIQVNATVGRWGSQEAELIAQKQRQIQDQAGG